VEETMGEAAIRRAEWRSPLGSIGLWLSARGLARLDFLDGNTADGVSWARRAFGSAPIGAASPDDALAAEMIDQLAAYFAGRRRVFDIPLDLQGTPFQRAVWEAVRAVPWGETRSYGEIARAIGRPQAVRAVGAANGANPLSIVVPCHRLVGAAGELRGYGGGLERKRALLALERGRS
jgi:methylated-DNA-[protein]-cysteine S-methyltransferase